MSFGRRVGVCCLVANVLGGMASCSAEHRHGTSPDSSGLDAGAGSDGGEGGTSSASGGHPELPDAGSTGPLCNGAAALCNQRFSAATFLGTHLSFASASSTGAVTQGRDLEGQLLVGGVRALELEIRLDGGALTLCSGSCSGGGQSLATTLRTIATFLQGNPRDVLTLVLRSTIPVDRLVAAFDDAELTPLAHSQVAGKPWPTLQEMLDEQHSLVVLLDQQPEGSSDLGAAGAGGAGGSSSGNGGSDEQTPLVLPTWLHALSTWAWETPADEGAACALVRGQPDAPLALLNHYRPGEAADDEALAASHTPEVIATRLARCGDDRGHVPNFVFVDFAEVGDPNGGTQRANGLR